MYAPPHTGLQGEIKGRGGGGKRERGRGGQEGKGEKTTLGGPPLLCTDIREFISRETRSGTNTELEEELITDYRIC